MKTLKILFGWLAGTLILLQFIKIEVPPPPKASKSDEIKAPKEVMKILKRSCYDCHSNQTKWPWYSKIAPISWEVNSHVKNGRAWLNFSIWEKYPKEKKKKLYQGIEKSITWQMPPSDYLLIHKDARLSKKQRDLIKKWAQKELEKLEN
jgi:hypothetical protein